MRILTASILLLCSLSVTAFTPTQDNLSQFQRITETHDSFIGQLLTRKLPEKWLLDRLDVELAVSASGDIGILGVSGQRAIELIWERQENKSQDLSELEKESEVSGSDNPEQVFIQLRDQILSQLSNENLNRRQLRRIKKLLRKDAYEISKWVLTLRDMPQVGEWYVDGFFKTYYFTSGVGLSNVAALSYDKRIRFRFTFSGPFKRTPPSDLTLTQKAHHRIMLALNRLSGIEGEDRKFELSRVWLRTDLMLEKDFVVFSAGAGRGYQTVYRRVPESQRSDTLSLMDRWNTLTLDLGELQTIPAALLNTTHALKQNDFPLSQIRLKFEFSADSGFKLATPEVTQVIDLHYFRREQ